MKRGKERHWRSLSGWYVLGLSLGIYTSTLVLLILTQVRLYLPCLSVQQHRYDTRKSYRQCRHVPCGVLRPVDSSHGHRGLWASQRSPSHIHETLRIADLLPFGYFPVAHSRRGYIHRRQSLGRLRVRLTVERVQSMGSREPHPSVPHDWCESLQRFRARREPVQMEIHIRAVPCLVSIVI